ncbi:MAG: ROK family transcriptional regulator, partial [Actinocatenispora sp.]
MGETTDRNDGITPWHSGRTRRINERALWDALRTAGPTSRAQLARRSGLSKPTVSSALATLERAALVRPVGTHVPEGRGRVAVLYEADPTAGHVVGVDIGTGTLRVALADLAATVVHRRDVPNRARTGATLARLVIDTVRDTVAAGGLDLGRIDRICVGTPGVYDSDRDRIRYAVNLPGWGRPGVLATLRADLGDAVELHNDANLAALAEYSSGVGAGSRLFLYLWIGAGLGMGIVADGRLFLGAGRAAGEIGFLPTATPPDAGEATEHGVLEDTVSARSVVRTGRALGMPAPLTARDVFDAARAGAEPALTAVRREAAQLAHVVATVSAVLDPDVVALGGTIGANADLLLEPVRRALRALTPLRPRVLAGTLPDAVLH